MTRFFQSLRYFDWFLFIAVFLLVCLGLIAIFSTSFSGEERDFTVFKKQVIFFVLGLILIFLFALFDFRLLSTYAYAFYGVSILLLIFVLLFGERIGGTKGWFDLGPFQFQPSEFAKIILLIVLSKYFASLVGRQSRFQFVVVSFVFMAVPVFLIMLQPDLGTALVFVFLWFSMLIFSGIKRKYVIALALIFILVCLFAWSFVLAPYQKERILTFINPERDPLGSGYSIRQAKIAIGSGGFLGKGLAHGSQSQLKFLPAQHTDFIFAVIAEEMGFLGASLCIGIFYFIIFRILRISRKSRGDFGLMLGLGACFLISFQVVVNIGMNLGILPVTGIPLPYVSYGGSALLANLILIGILESVIMRHKGVKFE